MPLSNSIDDEKDEAGNFKYRYTPTDLLNVDKGDEDWYHLVQSTVTAAFKDADEALNFRSKVVKDYFLEISTPDTKRHIRMTLKFFLTYAVSLVLLSPISDPLHGVQISTQALIFIGTAIICYLLTMRKNTYVVYSSVCTLGVLFTFAISLLQYSGLQVSLENHYTPASQLFVLMFAILPIRLELSFCMCSLFVAAFEICTFNRLSYGSNEKEHETTSFLRKIHHITFNHDREGIIAFIQGQLSLWSSCIFCGIYVHLSNQLRRRASFLRLGENVKAQQQVKDANMEQTKCIGAIVPDQVKTDYLSEKEANKQQTMWLFSKAYDNVSILFADIVGFTNMSSNKTAPQVVTLLNDLFNRFDNLCLLTNCEKLGTLGDCYYCVAGCPSPSYDHAASCVEAGLGMCRIIQAFNKDYRESVNMRVGVHTGRVNAAIIGNQRFRFDVYSNDVLIANTMESSGKPGRVHISELTFNHVQNMYTFEPGEDIEVKKEQKYGVAGMKLTLCNIKTYFVKPESSNLLKKSLDIETTKKGNIQILTTQNTEWKEPDAGDEDSSFDEDKSMDIADDEDIRFIDALRRDPDKQIKLFETPPLWSLMLTFMDDEVEYHYNAHTRDEIRPVYVDSVKLAPVVDCIASLIFVSFIAFACYCFNSEQFMKKRYFILLVFVVGIINTILIGWSSLKIAPHIKNRCTKFLFLIISHPCIKNVQSIFMCAIPCIICILHYDCKKFHKDHIYTSFFCSVSLFSLFGHAIYVSSFAWVNIVSSTMFTGFFLHLFTSHYECVADKCFHEKCATYTCRDIYAIHFLQFWDSYIFPICLSYILNLFVIVMVNRENEKNLRLCFFVTREAQIRCDEAQKAMIDSREMLHNIIPEYALKQIIACGGDITKGNFSYAVNCSNVAVIFSCISNFFSSYYREDYKGGEGALKLLNKIICNFDDVLKDPKFETVEKIKTINDCYMVAAGLNTELVAKSKDSRKHLRDLMYYSFEIQRELENFNDEYVFGNDKFEMKIGYNFGPVTAGVIGTTKPMYDIWGDTVNVASRMYSTGKPGFIQVTDKVKDHLLDHFKFTYKGTTLVKGKGEMQTYICEEKISHTLGGITFL